MRIAILHDMNNPTQEVPLDADDFSRAVPSGSGSAVYTKSSDAPFLVHETPREVVGIIENA
jgi:hypothetical protein